MNENGLAGSVNSKDCATMIAKAIGVMFAGRTVTHTTLKDKKLCWT